MFSLQGKNTFITGGASGIGLAVATQFINSGAKVVVSDINDGGGALDKIGAMFVKTDVSNEQDVANALAEAEKANGKLDVVINNAGIGESSDAFIEQRTEKELKKIFDINLFGVFYGLKHGPKHMKDGGSIINTASGAAFLAFPSYAIYSSTKAGIVSLTQSAAIELGIRGIRVNAVCPGTVITPLQPDDDPEAIMCKTATALGRYATTDDLIGLYHFLAAEASRYITGQAIRIDGGWSAGVSLGMVEKFFGDTNE